MAPRSSDISTRMVRQGSDLAVVVVLAGHRRLEATRRYGVPSDLDRLSAVENRLQIDLSVQRTTSDPTNPDDAQPSRALPQGTRQAAQRRPQSAAGGNRPHRPNHRNKTSARLTQFPPDRHPEGQC